MSNRELNAAPGELLILIHIVEKRAFPFSFGTLAVFVEAIGEAGKEHPAVTSSHQIGCEGRAIDEHFKSCGFEGIAQPEGYCSIAVSPVHPGGKIKVIHCVKHTLSVMLLASLAGGETGGNLGALAVKTCGNYIDILKGLSADGFHHLPLITPGGAEEGVSWLPWCLMVLAIEKFL